MIDRICAQCGSGEVEDAEHLLLRCVTRERMVLEKRMKKIIDGFQNRCDKEKVMIVLGEACRAGKTGRAVEEMWGLRESQIHGQGKATHYLNLIHIRTMTFIWSFSCTMNDILFKAAWGSCPSVPSTFISRI